MASARGESNWRLMASGVHLGPRDPFRLELGGGLGIPAVTRIDGVCVLRQRAHKAGHQCAVTVVPTVEDVAALLQVVQQCAAAPSSTGIGRPKAESNRWPPLGRTSCSSGACQEPRSSCRLTAPHPQGAGRGYRHPGREGRHNALTREPNCPMGPARVPHARRA